MNSGSERYKKMAIRELRHITDELKEQGKDDASIDAEYYIAYKVLQEKVIKRDKNRPKCIPTRFEHNLDLMEEF